MLSAIGFGATDVGRQRENNEDCFRVDNDLGLYIVSDGMGGHAGGEEAARMAAEVAAKTITARRALVERARQGLEHYEEVKHLAADAVQEACAQIYRLASSKPEHAGMGCTLTLLLMAGERAIMAHVGDSRLYLLRNGIASRLSTDHTFVEDLVRGGQVARADAKKHPYAHVLTRAVGTQASVHVETLVIETKVGDRFLLCSDGLSEYFEADESVASHLDGDLEALPDAMIAFANTEGGRDNITAIVLRVDADDDGEGEESVDALQALSRVPLFDNLSLAQLMRVNNAGEVMTLQVDAKVITEGDYCAELLVVVSGRLAVSRSGKRLGEVGAGDALGETNLLFGRPSRATVEALGPAEVFRLRQEEFWQIAKRRPWLGLELTKRLGAGACETLEKTRDQVADPNRRPFL